MKQKCNFVGDRSPWKEVSLQSINSLNVLGQENITT